MDTTTPTTPAAQAAPAPAAISRTKAWLVGGGLAGVALGSLATALALQGPGPAPSEPRETIVSTKSPTPRGAAAPVAPATPAPTRFAVHPTQPAPAAPAPASTRPACADCAVVQAVTAIERQGEATGLGAVGGAVAGGLLGNQMGGGSGKDAMTLIGAVGGGVAGHHMERRLRSSTEYRVRVTLADGRSRTLSHPTKLNPGEQVRVDGDRLVALAAARPPAAPTRTAAGSAPREAPRSMSDAKRL